MTSSFTSVYYEINHTENNYGMWFASRRRHGISKDDKPLGGPAHLFLSYAQKSARGNSLDCSQPTVFSDGSNSYRKSWSSSGSEQEDLQLEFDSILQEAGFLSGERSSEIAAILKDVAEECTELGGCNDNFAEYLSAIFDSQKIIADNEASISPQDDTVQEQPNRQHDEIAFLRSALKALLRTGDISSCEDEKTCPSPRSMHALVKDLDGVKTDQRSRNQEDCSQVFKPECLAIPRILSPCDAPDCEDSVLSDVTPSEEGIRIVSLEDELGLSTKAQYLLNESKGDRNMNQPTKEECKPATINLSVSTLTRRPTVYSGVAFTDMIKGEIQGNRARGIVHRIYFAAWGMELRGRYSGMVQNSLPHGSGVLRFDNGDFYCGQFEVGMLHGVGSLLLRRGGTLLKYRGHFAGNEFVGNMEIGSR